jgi:pimeloyl-ACP methyl ester carboxylesterase
MSKNTSDTTRPTVVLVHGAFADASSFNGVIQGLQAHGVQVTAPANPLRGISHDSAYLASVLDQIPGPVLAVGHSYGGAVISNAASMAKNVVGLVFVAAFAPDEGERLGEATGVSKDSILNAALMPRRYPSGPGAETAVEFVADPTKIHQTFGADLPEEVAAIVGATQRPVAELAFSEPNGRPAWKTLPSWAVIATEDKAAGTDVVRSMAERAGARITEVKGSHVFMVAQPQVVVDVILDAIEQTSAERPLTTAARAI